MGILTIVLIARIVVAGSGRRRPDPRLVRYVYLASSSAYLIFIIALLKNLTDNYSTWASYVGVVLAVVIAVGAWMQIQATGGVDSLRTEATSLGSSTSTSSAAPAATQPAAPAPAPAPAPLRSGGAERSPARSGGLGYDGCGLGRNERRAVDRAGHLDPLDTHFAAARGRRGGARPLWDFLRMPRSAHSRVP